MIKKLSKIEIFTKMKNQPMFQMCDTLSDVECQNCPFYNYSNCSDALKYEYELWTKLNAWKKLNDD